MFFLCFIDLIAVFSTFKRHGTLLVITQIHLQHHGKLAKAKTIKEFNNR